MNRASRACAAAALVLSALLLLPASAAAADTDVVRHLGIEVDIRPDGVLEVTESYAWDFGDRHGLGLTRVLDARVDYEPDPAKVRVYEYGDIAAASPSGAPAGVWVSDDGPRLRIDVGAPDGSDDRRTGLQTYVLRYTVSGALNAVRDHEDVPDQDELYWNVTGHDWQVPIERVTVMVSGPTDVVDHACYQGTYGSTAPCEEQLARGAHVAATGGDIAPGSGLTIMAAFPPGTFERTAPILTDRPTSPFTGSGPLSRTADFLWSSAAWLVPLGLVVPLGIAVWRVRQGRDLHYPDLTPGLLPAPGTDPRVATLRRRPPAAVRFTPPEGLRPAEVGALTDKRVTATHVTATVVDLAVRGHLRIHEERTGRGKPHDWRLVDTPERASGDRLTPYEHTVLTGLFGARRQVLLSQLRTHFHRTMAEARSEVAQEVTARGLFRTPLTARAEPAPLPWLFLAGLVLVFLLGLFSELPSATVFLLIVGVVLLVACTAAVWATRRARRQRTATGHALHEQSRGFAHYLATAEGNQLRFEEGEDLFSRYLPYAIVYGVAERWAEVFARLEADGVRMARPSWYVGTSTYDTGGFGDLGNALSSFSSAASTTLSSTPGASGASGSSGGGFSGGGGGGGGGGGR